MLGTIVNTATILIGGVFGSFLRTGIKEKYKKALFDALGLCCIVLGINASLPNMAKSEYPVLFIASLAIGSIIGTRLDLQGRIDRANARLNERNGNENNGLQGLMTGILLYCIGTFSIVGPVLSALSPSQGWAIGESANTFLYTNATLDLVTSTVFGYFCGDGMPEPMRVELSIVGGVLIVSSGLGILGIKDCKTVNLLPSLLVPVGFYLVKMIIE